MASPHEVHALHTRLPNTGEPSWALLPAIPQALHEYTGGTAQMVLQSITSVLNPDGPPLQCRYAVLVCDHMMLQAIPSRRQKFMEFLDCASCEGVQLLILHIGVSTEDILRAVPQLERFVGLHLSADSYKDRPEDHDKIAEAIFVKLFGYIIPCNADKGAMCSNEVWKTHGGLAANQIPTNPAYINQNAPEVGSLRGCVFSDGGQSLRSDETVQMEQSESEPSSLEDMAVTGGSTQPSSLEDMAVTGGSTQAPSLEDMAVTGGSTQAPSFGDVSDTQSATQRPSPLEEVVTGGTAPLCRERPADLVLERQRTFEMLRSACSQKPPENHEIRKDHITQSTERGRLQGVSAHTRSHQGGAQTPISVEESVQASSIGQCCTLQSPLLPNQPTNFPIAPVAPSRRNSIPSTQPNHGRLPSVDASTMTQTIPKIPTGQTFNGCHNGQQTFQRPMPQTNLAYPGRDITNNIPYRDERLDVGVANGPPADIENIPSPRRLDKRMKDLPEDILLELSISLEPSMVGVRNWRCFAACKGISNRTIEYLESKGNPTRDMLRQAEFRTCTVREFKQLCVLHQREDVIEDVFDQFDY